MGDVLGRRGCSDDLQRPGRFELEQVAGDQGGVNFIIHSKALRLRIVQKVDRYSVVESATEAWEAKTSNRTLQPAGRMRLETPAMQLEVT